MSKCDEKDFVAHVPESAVRHTGAHTLELVWMIILTISVLVSLALNVKLLHALFMVRGAVLDSVVEVRSSVAMLSRQPVEMQVHVAQEVPLETVVPISQMVSLPLNFDYPLSTVINTGFNIPLLGRQEVVLPIEAVIPISYTVNVPLQIEVPVSLMYHLEMDLPVQVQIPPELGSKAERMLSLLEQALQVGSVQVQ